MKKSGNKPKLTFMGATGTVTGSKYLLEWCDKRIMVDCGLFQGYKELRLRNRAPLPIDPKSIDAIVLTHAHLDHTGYLPLMVRQGFRGPIYCTEPTAALASLILRDSAHIQELDARYARKKKFSKHNPPLPLYTVADAEQSLRQLAPKPYETLINISDEITLTLSEAGHILGSSLVRLRSKDCSILFSGDLGRPIDPVMYPPSIGGKPDYLVIESTYGSRLHGDEDIEASITKVITETAEKGGSVLFPTFAVGRAHTLLYLIQKLRAEGRIPSIPVFLDSPMAISGMEIYCRFHKNHKLDTETCRRTCEVAQYVRSADESKALNLRAEPRIILSASGMLTGGRVLHHLKQIGPDPRSTIVFIGYQAEGTRGAKMLEGAPKVKVHGEMVPIRARTECIHGLSAHADYSEMLNWLRAFEAPPSQTFITHGAPSASQAFALKIQNELGWRCMIPNFMESVALNSHVNRAW